MGFRAKVHAAIAAKLPAKPAPLTSIVFVDIDAADRQEAVASGKKGGRAAEDAWLVAEAHKERFYARSWLSPVVEEEGTSMRITPSTPDSLL